MNDDPIRHLIRRWRNDPLGTYQTWFLWDERLKNFRSIRRGISQVVSEIDAGQFGNRYRGSSLETIVHSVAEQRQIFKGADHAFLWKPKLRIPDIYESAENQKAFARLLHTCSCCNTAEEVIHAIHTIDHIGIKGLGPAVANLLYFLHPTLMPPFNTAIVSGYNALTGARVKLGRWKEYLAMRAGILQLNETYGDVLSNDLGAIAGLLFDLGSNRYPVPPRVDDVPAREAWEKDLAIVRAESASVLRAQAQAKESDRTHTEIQGWLRDLGLALGYTVWIASNDRSRTYNDGRLSHGCLERLPDALAQSSAADAIRLIDILWLDGSKSKVMAAFEVEHTTSIYSGIVRMLDLALSGDTQASEGLYLVAPDNREAEVLQQLRRPAFSRVSDLKVRYLPYGELEKHRETMGRFGNGIKGVHAISKLLT